ncbi:MAG: GntR family transcriptional regulator [Lachnospiraceae bacterium]|nr:GntR family transcriptional regulator [Lachnospiraceae bacterium]
MPRTKYRNKSDEFLPLRDSVYNTLRGEILTGELHSGERLMEIHLADRLGVSRTPIREAIRMLELEGLVTMIPRRGAHVAQITEKRMNDELEVREALDALCVELACLRITDTELQALEQAALHFEEMVRTNDNRAIAQADVDFHNIIIYATRNDRLISVEDSLSQSIYLYRYEYIKDVEGHARLVEEHREILEALRERDPKRASAAARLHVENQKSAINRQLQGN